MFLHQLSPSVPLPEQNLVISLNNVCRQKFDFSFEIIKLILANANYNLVKKLYFTCKYFPAKFRLYLIDELNIYNKITFNKSQKEFDPLSLLDSMKDKIWLGDKFCTFNLPYSKWISNIQRCTIKVLKGGFYGFPWNYFVIIAKAKTIEELRLDKVLYLNGEMVSLEEICALLPKLKDLCLINAHVTPNSMKEIYKTHDKKTKIHKFGIHKVGGPLNAEDYLKFFQEFYHKDGSWLSVGFTSDVPGKQDFIAAVDSAIKEWQSPKPTFFGF